MNNAQTFQNKLKTLLTAFVPALILTLPGDRLNPHMPGENKTNYLGDIAQTKAISRKYLKESC